MLFKVKMTIDRFGRSHKREHAVSKRGAHTNDKQLRSYIDSIIKLLPKADDLNQLRSHIEKTAQSKSDNQWVDSMQVINDLEVKIIGKIDRDIYGSEMQINSVKSRLEKLEKQEDLTKFRSDIESLIKSNSANLQAEWGAYINSEKKENSVKLKADCKKNVDNLEKKIGTKRSVDISIFNANFKKIEVKLDNLKKSVNEIEGKFLEITNIVDMLEKAPQSAIQQASANANSIQGVIIDIKQLQSQLSHLAKSTNVKLLAL